MLDLHIDGHIAQVVLNHPSKMNAMGPWFWDEMPNVFRQIDESPDVRVAVLRAEGRAFSAGLDLVGMMPRLPLGASGPDNLRQAKLHRLIRDMQWAVTCVERCRVPVIAAIQGAGFDYGMSPAGIARKVVQGSSVLWTRKASVVLK